MAVYGVLGDIHGNAEALTATLSALDEQLHHPPLLCVGDIVGFNADSDRCALLMREREVQSVAGNHDLIGISRLGIERCSTNAMHALKRTRRSLLPQTKAYLQSLPTALEVETDLVLVHGGVRDVQQYMTQPRHIEENITYLRTDFPGRHICFYGHMHQQKVFEVGEDGTVRDVPVKGVVDLSPGIEYFINPGSVDASRKSTHKLAEYAIFDSDRLTVEFFRIPYDDAATELKAAAGGYRMPSWRHFLYSAERRFLTKLSSLKNRRT